MKHTSIVIVPLEKRYKEKANDDELEEDIY